MRGRVNSYKFLLCTIFFSRETMKTNIEQYVIDQVKKRRMELKISQVALADYINVSKGFIGNVEVPKNDYKYNLNHLNEIAKVLHCSIRDFFPEKPLD